MDRCSAKGKAGYLLSKRMKAMKDYCGYLITKQLLEAAKVLRPLFFCSKCVNPIKIEYGALELDM